MNKTAATEVMGCILDAGQDAKTEILVVSQPLGYSPMLSSWSNNFDAMFYTDVMFQHAKASGAPDGVKTKRP